MKTISCRLLVAIALAGWFTTGLPSQAANPWFFDSPGPGYQVLVYSFADSDDDGWGDLNGLRSRLDYLNDGQPGSGKSLEVSALWLSPISPAASYHGYDVTDYKAVDPRLGSLADFDKLVAAAHQRGIRIVLDMVFNHTSSGHPWFEAMLKEPGGPYGTYYVKKDPAIQYGSGGMGNWYNRSLPNGGSVSYFAAFWDQMPDLNAANPAVVSEYREILAFWLSHGVDGFRFDAAMHVFDINELPKGSSSLALNKAFWTGLRDYARSLKPDVWFIGEVFSTSTIEVRAYGASLDSLFDFPDAKFLLATSLSGLDTGIARNLATNYAQYGRVSGFLPLPFLSNHDQDRVMGTNLNLAGASAVFGWAPEIGDSQAILRAKRQGQIRSRLMAAIVQTMPGLPFIYYGEELGMTGRRYQNDDISRRDAFPWGNLPETEPSAGSGRATTWPKSTNRLEPGNNRATPDAATQDRDPASLLNLYRRLAELRRTQPALRSGGLVETAWPGFNQGTIISWLRGQPSTQVLVIHNLGENDQSLPLPSGIGLSLVFDSGAVTAQGFRSPMATRDASPSVVIGKLLVPAGTSQVWTLVAP